MKINRLKIKKFKNFSELDITFASGVNLFVGGNGSGKTSILEAINVALGGFFNTLEQKMQRTIKFDEIKITQAKRESLSTIWAESTLITEPWWRSIKRDTKSNDTQYAKPAGIYGKSFFDAFEDPENRIVAPVIAYYSTQRLFKESSISIKQKYDPANGRRNGYILCLGEASINANLREWLGNAVTRRATLQIKEIVRIDQVLENVEKAIRETLIMFLELPVDFSLKIYQDPELDNEVYIHYDDEHDFPLTYYSDGFRNLLYLVIDLVWRASQLNPWMTLKQLTESEFGVVTIDEIDLHLHPKWQSKAIKLIQTLFPKVQFFVTTHSPTVVANFENGTLYVIDDNKIYKHQTDYFGSQINSVLRNVLGASDRHIPTQRKLDELFRLIDENNPDQYNPLLEELKLQLGEEDVDINKAQALIEWQTSN